MTHHPEVSPPKPRSPRPVSNLTWAVVEGVPQEVSEFSHLPPRARPAASCPQCKRTVTMKLGQVVAHHFAHRPGDECAASGGETALHLNAKFHLARELRRGSSVLVAENCADDVRDPRSQYGGRLPCPESHARAWDVPGWTEVEVELAVGTRRPDITLLVAGTAVAAVEIVVSHSVDEAKAADLAASGVPWLEVAAHDVLGDPDRPWSEETPLPVLRFSQAGSWICPAHVAAREERAARAAQAVRDARAAEEARERRRKNRVQRWLFRVVDLYWPSGKKFREIYEMVVRIVEGKVVKVWLERRSRGQLVATAERLDREGAWQCLAIAFERELAVMRGRGATVDSPMQWTRSERVSIDSDLVAYGDLRFPRRFGWSPKNARWFPLREHRQTSWDSGVDEDEGAPGRRE